VTWSTLGTVEVETEGVSLLFAFVMLIFDTFFYLLLSQYISAINPGTFGSRKSPLFFLRVSNKSISSSPFPIGF